jgi:hypothetical protein
MYAHHKIKFCLLILFPVIFLYKIHALIAVISKMLEKIWSGYLLEADFVEYCLTI